MYRIKHSKLAPECYSQNVIYYKKIKIGNKKFRKKLKINFFLKTFNHNDITHYILENRFLQKSDYLSLLYKCLKIKING